jgi:hypothetical protein
MSLRWLYICSILPMYTMYLQNVSVLCPDTYLSGCVWDLANPVRVGRGRWPNSPLLVMYCCLFVGCGILESCCYLQFFALAMYSCPAWGKFLRGSDQRRMLWECTLSDTCSSKGVSTLPGSLSVSNLVCVFVCLHLFVRWELFLHRLAFGLATPPLPRYS